MLGVILLGFLIGIVLGSAGLALAGRIIKGKSLGGRSYCEYCNTKLKVGDLLPILSFLVLSGRCRYCRKKLSYEYPAVEAILGILTAILFTLSLSNFQLQGFGLNQNTLFLVLGLTFKLYILAILAIIFIIDLKTGFIPNKLVYPSIVVSIAYAFITSLLKSVFFYQDLIKNPLGKYLISSSNYLFDQLYRFWVPLSWDIIAAFLASASFALLIIATKGRGMGWGDVKYVFLIGLVVGFPNIILAVFLSFLFGALAALVLLVLGKKHFGQTIPFGPFLSAGAVVTMFWGREIIDWYFRTFS